MKPPLILAFALLGLTGCIARHTATNVHVYLNDAKVFTAANKTSSRGLFTKADAVKLQANITNRYSFTTNGLSVLIEDAKDFSADKIASAPDPDAIKATGAAAGEAIGAAVKKTVTPAIP